MELSKSDREALKDIGITHATVLEERIDGRGEVNRLLRGKGIDGHTTLYGWWNHGESAADIQWQYEQANA